MEFLIKIIIFIVIISFLYGYFRPVIKKKVKQDKPNSFVNDSFTSKKDTTKICPRCKIGKLVNRKAKKQNNKYSSVDFIGCDRFPKCRYNENIVMPKEKNQSSMVKDAEVKTKPKEIKRTSYAEKIKKGAEFESYVASVYQSRGYNVSEYGKVMGKKDQGIDLIAKKEKHIVLIQCKNWNKEGKWKIKHNDILAFRQRSYDFLEERKIFQNYDITSRYTLSGDFIHASAIKHLEEIQAKGKKVDYEIIEMPIL